MDARRSELLTSLGLLILRLGMGGYMLTHGMGKLRMLLDGQAASFGDPIGVGPTLSLVTTVLAEFLCSLLVMAGAGTRFAAALVVVVMGVAGLVVHGGDPWTSEWAAKQFMAGTAKSWASKEPALLFAIGFLTLVFTGAGRFSLDHLFTTRRRG